MAKVSIDRIVSVTEARSRLSELVEEAKDEEFWVLTKGGKPKVALVDVVYLEQLIRRAWFNDLASQSQAAFTSYLERQGLNYDDLSEKEIEALLTIE